MGVGRNAREKWRFVSGVKKGGGVRATAVAQTKNKERKEPVVASTHPLFAGTATAGHVACAACDPFPPPTLLLHPYFIVPHIAHMRRRRDAHVPRPPPPLPALLSQASEAAWLAGTGAVSTVPCKLVFASGGVKGAR